MLGTDWIAIFDEMADGFLKCDIRDASLAVDNEDAETKEVYYDFSNWDSIDVGLVTGIPDVFIRTDVNKYDENNAIAIIDIYGMIETVPFSETKYYENDDTDGYCEKLQSNAYKIYEEEVLPLLKTCKNTFVKGTQLNNITIKDMYCQSSFDIIDNTEAVEFKISLALYM